jgi:hypothetical protein
MGFAASIASVLHKAGWYLPFFEFPSIAQPYSPSRDVNKDGYFARVVGERATYRITNALARIQPHKILLLGITPIQKTYLEAFLPKEKIRDVSSVEDFLEMFSSILLPADIVECSPHYIVEGLLKAQSTGKRLVIRSDAAPIGPPEMRGKGSLIVIENTSSIEDIAAVNYATCIGSDALIIDGVDRSEIRNLPRELYAWSRDRSHPAFKTLKRRVAKILGKIDLSQYDDVTFFTLGIPYGLAIENKIPAAHVLKDLDCGVFILDILIEEIEPLLFDSAVIFSPQPFESDETSDVERILTDDNYVVKQVLGRSATVRNLADYAAHYPFDCFHICSHGGETNGYFSVQEFPDRHEAKHVVEYYEVVSFSPGRPDKVKVSRKIIFKTFDGFPWGSEPISAMAKYIFDDMLKAIKENPLESVKRVRADYPIALSCHIQCSDSIHQGDFDYLAGIGHPIVFNNSCSSSHELAANFIHAGARCYIGTLWSVGNKTAQTAARVFYEAVSKEGRLLQAFFKMSNDIANLRYKHVYIFWGLPISTYRKPSYKSTLRIQGALANSFLSVTEAETKATDQFSKEHHSDAKKFLWAEMNKNMFRGKSRQPADQGTHAKQESPERRPTRSTYALDPGAAEIELESEDDSDNRALAPPSGHELED